MRPRRSRMSKKISDFVYHVRYAWTLYRHTDMSMKGAWNYPMPWDRMREDPVGDAISEVSYWNED